MVILVFASMNTIDSFSRAFVSEVQCHAPAPCPISKSAVSWRVRSMELCMRPYVVHLIHEHQRPLWLLRWEHVSLGFFVTKEEALAAGGAECEQVWKSGTPSRLVVHRDDGSIETERDYA